MLPLIFISIFILSFSDVLTEKHSRPLKSGEISINVQNEQDLAILLKNVSDINISGSPGFISAYGPDAFPVLCGQMGSSTDIYHPIAVASRLGAGKLLGTTHDGFLIPETPTATSDRNKFVLNSIHWTSQTPNPVVAVIRDEEDSFVSYLQNSSIPAIRIPVAELTGVAQLKKFDVVIVKEFFGPTYAPIFTEYVEMGGGLIICLTSWAYYYFMQVPGHFGTNFPANMISTKAGFAWHGDALADPTTPHKTYNASTALLENTKVLESWEKVKQVINSGYNANPDVNLQRYSTVLEYGFEVIPKNDPFWDGDYYAEAQNFTQVGGQPVPTKENPVKEDYKKFELQVFHAMSAYVLKPEDMPAHPASFIFPGDAGTKLSTVGSEQVTIKYKKPTWFREFARSAKNPWSYVPNSINICHEGEDADGTRSTKMAGDETVEVSNKLPLWFSTGLYARPGQQITATLKSPENLDSWGIQIGSHTDDNGKLAEWHRCPRITLKSSFVNNTVTMTSPYGGLIYFIIPESEISEQEKTVTATVSGSISSPYFRLGETQKREWMNTIRHSSGPWAEFVTDNIILTVPSASIRELDDPEDLLLFWNQVMDAIADLAGIPRERYRQERMVPDKQISLGFMHSGYPIMTLLNEGNMAVNKSLLRTEGSWGHFHELGHNHQSGDWTFGGTGEVTCNLFALYVLNSVCGIPTEKTRAEMSPQLYKVAVTEYIATGLDFNHWKSKPFLALMTYVQLERTYGWTAFKQVFAKYRALPAEQRPQNDQQKIDMWMTMFSKTVGEDLSSFFLSWGHPVTDEARNSISDLPGSGLSMSDLLND